MPKGGVKGGIHGGNQRGRSLGSFCYGNSTLAYLVTVGTNQPTNNIQIAVHRSQRVNLPLAPGPSLSITNLYPRNAYTSSAPTALSSSSHPHPSCPTSSILPPRQRHSPRLSAPPRSSRRFAASQKAMIPSEFGSRTKCLRLPEPRVVMRG